MTRREKGAGLSSPVLSHQLPRWVIGCPGPTRTPRVNSAAGLEARFTPIGGVSPERFPRGHAVLSSVGWPAKAAQHHVQQCFAESGRPALARTRAMPGKAKCGQGIEVLLARSYPEVRMATGHKRGGDRCAGVQALHPTDPGNDYPAPSSAPLLSGSGLTPRTGIVAKVN